MKLIRWISTLTVAAGLLLATVGAVSAQETGDQKGFVGFVAEYTGADADGVVTDAGVLALTLLGTEESQDVAVPEGLSIRYPGQEADVETEIGIQVSSLGDTVGTDRKVAVLAEWDGTQWVATQITVTPSQPLNTPVQGAVVSVQDGVLTIMNADGTIRRIQIGQQDAPPAIGELITAFARSGGDDEGDAPVAASGLVRAEEVRQRLEGFLEQVTSGQADLSEEARARSVDELATLLETHAQHHVDILQTLSERDLPAEALQGIATALENAKRGREEAKARAEEARAQAGPPEDRPGRPDDAGEEGQPEETPTPPAGGQDDQGQPEETPTPPAEGQGGATPQVSFANISAGAQVSGTVSLNASVSIADGNVVQVEFFVDGSSIGTDSDGTDGWSISWDTTTIADGSHTLEVVATTDDGETASTSITAVVSNGQSQQEDGGDQGPPDGSPTPPAGGQGGP